MPAGIFLVTAALTAIAGVALSRLADAVAKRSGLGGLIVGLILVALITSLSEVAAAISAARLAVPDIAAGDLFGASLMNMGILGFVDLMIHRRRRLLAEVTLDHVLTGGLSIVLVGVASVLILLKPTRTLGPISQASLLLLLTYFIGLWVLSRHKRAATDRQLEKESEQLRDELARRLETIAWPILALLLAAASLVILVSAPFLVSSAHTLATATGIGDSFFGTLFVGLTTTIPEFVVSLTAVRIASFDLVVGELFGSISFNMLVLVVLDAATPNGSVFPALAQVHAVTGILVIVVMAVALMGLVFRSEKRYLLLEPDATLILLMVAASFYILWRRR